MVGQLVSKNADGWRTAGFKLRNGIDQSVFYIMRLGLGLGVGLTELFVLALQHFDLLLNQLFDVV